MRKRRLYQYEGLKRREPAFTPQIRIIKWPIKENKKFHETQTEGHPSKH